MTWTRIGDAVKRPWMSGQYSRCVCSCGAEGMVAIRGGELKSESCLTCSQRERRAATPAPTRHGHARGKNGTPTYLAWRCAIQRCENPKAIGYDRYGGRGIRVCDRWRGSFDNFLADVGERPTPEHSIDRINNDGNYEPGNVRWTTRTEQGRNRSTNRYITVGGETLTVVAWAERTGISASSIYQRLARGWSDAQTVTTPIVPKRGRARPNSAGSHRS